MVSCIGAWGVGAPHALPFASVSRRTIVYHYLTDCKGDFDTVYIFETLLAVKAA